MGAIVHIVRFHGLRGATGLAPRARWREAAIASPRICAIDAKRGLSKCSNSLAVPNANATRTKVKSVVWPPDSSLRTAPGEMPARAASSAWVRFCTSRAWRAR